MTPPPTTIRSKEVCMLESDWRDFGNALAEQFPEARYYMDPDYINDPKAVLPTAKPPMIALHKHLLGPERDPWLSNWLTMVFDPEWQPQFRKYYYPEEAPKEWHWLLLPPPHPSVRFRLGGDIREKPVPHPDIGGIDFYATPRNKEHLALAAKFFRLFAKFATNKKDLVRVRVPSLEVTAPVVKGTPSWCGYHAIEWAREDPNRVLFYTPVGFGTRPTGQVLALPDAAKRPSRRTQAKA